MRRALFDATFVAKKEARRWPLLGWLLARGEPVVAFIGDTTLWQSLCAIAAIPHLAVEVRDCGELDLAGLDRKQSARLAHAAVQSSVCGSASFPARQEAPGSSGSGSPAGWSPSSAGPTWASSTEVSRT